MTSQPIPTPQKPSIRRTDRNLRIDIANISDADAIFLAGVVALLTDPDQDQQLRGLRAGSVALRYEPARGYCCVHNDHEPDLSAHHN